MFYEKDALRNFAKFTGKNLCQGLFLNKVAGLRQPFHFLSVLSDIVITVLKTSQKSHLFLDVSKSSLRCLSQWWSDWDLSETSYTDWVNFKYCHNLIVITSGVLLFISFSFVQGMLWKIYQETSLSDRNTTVIW